MAQHVLDLLKERGFIAQTTFEDELYKQLEEPDHLLRRLRSDR